MIYSEEVAKLWLAKCYEEASKSPDPSTHVGAALVIGNVLQVDTLSHNGPTAGRPITTEEWEDKPLKYKLVAHAERRAIYRAARQGLWTDGATLVGNWAACTDCAIAIVESGIKQLVRHSFVDVTATPGWERSVELGDEIMLANGIEIVTITSPIPGAPKVLRGGSWVDPSV